MLLLATESSRSVSRRMLLADPATPVKSPSANLSCPDHSLCHSEIQFCIHCWDCSGVQCSLRQMLTWGELCTSIRWQDLISNACYKNQCLLWSGRTVLLDEKCKKRKKLPENSSTRAWFLVLRQKQPRKKRGNSASVMKTSVLRKQNKRKENKTIKWGGGRGVETTVKLLFDLFHLASVTTLFLASLQFREAALPAQP